MSHLLEHNVNNLGKLDCNKRRIKTARGNTLSTWKIHKQYSIINTPIQLLNKINSVFFSWSSACNVTYSNF